MANVVPEQFDSLPDQPGMTRRHFIKLAGISAIGVTALGHASSTPDGVSLVCDPADITASASPSQWSTSELEKALTSRGITVHRHARLAEVERADVAIVIAGTASPVSLDLLRSVKTAVPALPESLGLVPLYSEHLPVLLACGHDVRGLVYAVLELADRVRFADDPLAALHLQRTVIEQPANATRSLCRLFVSDVEDKPWFNDRTMWQHYLSMLATQRFNRFSLALGLGYDALQNVTDAYFLFAYPFLLSVPGYNVRVPQLPDAERDSNLAMLKFISEQTVARGMDFQLGVWMHGYEWLNSPHPNYTIEGLTPETQGPYCRDALRRLLQSCPAISGITLRIHGESGVKEGSFKFWETVLEGIKTCGRTVRIDLHAKGITSTMIDMALATGMPVTVSPKYWAEHLGLPYHQADIREYDMPKPGKSGSGLMALSEGSRSFTRYGYGDLLKEDRRYSVMYRVWPGTQRLLLWGDPEWAAAHAQAFGFCGGDGVELLEPLAFKGRRGSGIAGDRCAYLDTSLTPQYDYEKYLYSVRVFGRLAYNPETDPEVWRRLLQRQVDRGAEHAEQALATASRILPIILTTHGVSAANDHYWPEMYSNLSLIDPTAGEFYFDTPSPKVFGNVSPMDPQLFLRISECAKELLSGERSGKYSPIEYAQCIEDAAAKAAEHLAEAEKRMENRHYPEFRRLAEDVAIMAGLGRFFGAKIRAGILFAIFEHSGDRKALEQALKVYKNARAHWASFAQRAATVYQSNITVGESPAVRGHWLDRLPAIDADILLLEKKLEETPKTAVTQANNVKSAIQEALGSPVRPTTESHHIPPEHYTAGEPLALELPVERMVKSATLYYRHVNQGERYQKLEMELKEGQFRGVIPRSYADGVYPLQYYFVLRENASRAWMVPGFNASLTNQPYFVVRRK